MEPAEQYAAIGGRAGDDRRTRRPIRLGVAAIKIESGKRLGRLIDGPQLASRRKLILPRRRAMLLALTACPATALPRVAAGAAHSAARPCGGRRVGGPESPAPVARTWRCRLRATGGPRHRRRLHGGLGAATRGPRQPLKRHQESNQPDQLFGCHGGREPRCLDAVYWQPNPSQVAVIPYRASRAGS